MKVSKKFAAGMALLAILAMAGCNSNGAAGTGAAGTDTSVSEATKVQRRSDLGVTNTNVVRPLPAPAPAPVMLPEGTILAVRTTSTLSTNSQVAGQSFTAHLVEPLVLNGRQIAGKGAEVEGRIVDADKGGRVKDVASIAVQLTGLRLLDGQMLDISTSSLGFEAKTTKGKDATKIGIGSGVGAAIGAIAGGGKGAAIGAAAGAGAGTGAVLATHGDAAVIPSESLLNFRLRSAATIAASR